MDTEYVKYVTQMRFLDDTYEPRETTLLGMEDSSTDEFRVPTPEQFPSLKRSRSEVSTEKLNLTKRFVDLVEQKTQRDTLNMTPSEKGFADMLTEDMRVLPMEVQRRLRIEILQLVQNKIESLNK